jgi:hypothetical protein
VAAFSGRLSLPQETVFAFLRQSPPGRLAMHPEVVRLGENNVCFESFANRHKLFVKQLMMSPGSTSAPAWAGCVMNGFTKALPTLDDSLRFAEQHVGDILHTPKSPDGAAYRFIVRGAGRFGNGARSGRPNEVLATTRREAELRRLHAVAQSIAMYLEERIEAEAGTAGKA